MKKNSGKLVIIVVVMVGVLIYFLPNLYKLNNELFKKKVTGSKTVEKKKKKDNITLDSDTIKDLTFPNLNSNIYTSDTYFKKDTFSVNDLSNNDILAFAFTQIYDGYIVNAPVQGCTTTGKSFNIKYLNFRIKNTISNTIKYSYTDFNVSVGNYPGLWKFNGTDTYNYNGNCSPSNVLYYDLQKLTSVKATDDNKTLEITAKVAFAKVENNNYTIYSDPNMQGELDKGQYTNLDDLNNKLNNMNTKKYKYVFKQGLCSYDAYCIKKGEWLNE